MALLISDFQIFGGNTIVYFIIMNEEYTASILPPNVGFLPVLRFKEKYLDTYKKCVTFTKSYAPFKIR